MHFHLCRGDELDVRDVRAASAATHDRVGLFDALRTDEPIPEDVVVN
jgi:hypothetical protein